MDLLLLHPPSVYDFRKRAILYGPISDLIPSSPIFEMYPLGFLTMTDYLEARGMRVRIVNLALRMMNDVHFDVPSFLATLSPRAIGIDLHWLPHAHGALEVAAIAKQVHPDVPVIMGGLSATYYHEELIRSPFVDFVLRGDAVEPPLYDLLCCLQSGRPPAQVPNLTWKQGNWVHINPMTFTPASLDYADLAPDRLVEMVLRTRDLQSVLPFNGWWQNPITAVFSVRGCLHDCATCGNSRSGSERLSQRHGCIYRSPASLVKNVVAVSRLSRGPIFLVGDLHQSGRQYAAQVLDLLRRARPANEIIFEIFDMPPLEYLDEIDRSVRNWSLELSPESHDTEVRHAQEGYAAYTNEAMEEVIEHALALHCHRIDVFFMIGLSQQTRTSVMETINYCDHLLTTFDSRLSCFISPMGPFLDPASRAFEHPAEHGYRLFARTLEEHRQLLVQPSWSQVLNYETEWMTREELAAVTYEAGQALNALKRAHGRLDAQQGEAIERRITAAREMQARIASGSGGVDPDPETLAQLYGNVESLSVSTVCDKSELFWSARRINFHPLEILRIAARSLLPARVRRGPLPER